LHRTLDEPAQDPGQECGLPETPLEGLVLAAHRAIDEVEERDARPVGGVIILHGRLKVIRDEQLERGLMLKALAVLASGPDVIAPGSSFDDPLFYIVVLVQLRAQHEARLGESG